MEFTKSSTVGALLAGILVTILALWMAQMGRTSPEDIERAIAGIKEVSHLVLDDSQLNREPATLLRDLDRLNETLSALFRVHAEGSLEDMTTFETAMRISDMAYEALNRHPRVTPQQLRQGHLSLFRILFLAAEIVPERYSDRFETEGDVLLRDEQFPQRKAIYLLKCFHACRFHGDVPDEVLVKLKDYSDNEFDPRLGVDFYLLVADEMANRRNLELARQILKQGIAAYDQEQGRSKLVNRLIDLDPTMPH